MYTIENLELVRDVNGESYTAYLIINSNGEEVARYADKEIAKEQCRRLNEARP